MKHAVAKLVQLERTNRELIGPDVDVPPVDKFVLHEDALFEAVVVDESSKAMILVVSVDLAVVLLVQVGLCLLQVLDFATKTHAGADVVQDALQVNRSALIPIYFIGIWLSLKYGFHLGHYFQRVYAPVVQFFLKQLLLLFVLEEGVVLVLKKANNHPEDLRIPVYLYLLTLIELKTVSTRKLGLQH